VGSQSIRDVTLSETNHPAWVSFMPNDVYTGNVAQAGEVEVFKAAPMTIGTALNPCHIHWNSPPSHAAFTQLA